MCIRDRSKCPPTCLTAWPPTCPSTPCLLTCPRTCLLDLFLQPWYLFSPDQTNCRFAHFLSIEQVNSGAANAGIGCKHIVRHVAFNGCMQVCMVVCILHIGRHVAFNRANCPWTPLYLLCARRKISIALNSPICTYCQRWRRIGMFWLLLQKLSLHLHIVPVDVLFKCNGKYLYTSFLQLWQC